MKIPIRIALVLLCISFIVLIVLVRHYRGDQYEILKTVFLTTASKDVLKQPAALCYSNEQLRQAVKNPAVLDQVGISGFDLDKSNLITCIVSNYTVDRVVGRQNFGLIILRKAPTNGISFTVFKGTKRFLQFNYPEAQR